MLTIKFFITLVALTLTLPVAQAQRETTPAPQATSTLAPPYRAELDERQLQSQDHYRNKEAQIIPSPAKSTHSQIPSGASAKCRDATDSFSQNRCGTCSHHEGLRVGFN
jgi:hypothetical protein